MDNQTILQKAQLSIADITADGGYLLPAQAKEFIRLAIKQATLMPLCTVKPMKSHNEYLENIKFGTRILHAVGGPGVALAEADRSKPTTGKVELATHEFKAEVRLDDSVAEDSIEQGQLKQTILDLLSERIAADMDEIVINSDTTSAVFDYSKFNGLLAGATSHVYSHAVATTNRTLWKSMLKSMPQQYLRDKKNMRYLTSVNSVIDYGDALADRATQLGDTRAESEVLGGQLKYAGVPITEIPLFPENLGVGTNCTNAVLVNPKNYTIGIWRQVRIEFERLVREGVTVIVASTRFDAKYAVEDATVKATNVKVA